MQIWFFSPGARSFTLILSSYWAWQNPKTKNTFLLMLQERKWQWAGATPFVKSARRNLFWQLEDATLGTFSWGYFHSLFSTTLVPSLPTIVTQSSQGILGSDASYLADSGSYSELQHFPTHSSSIPDTKFRLTNAQAPDWPMPKHHLA